MTGLFFLLGVALFLAGLATRHDIGSAFFVAGLLLMAAGYLGAFL